MSPEHARGIASRHVQRPGSSVSRCLALLLLVAASPGHSQGWAAPAANTRFAATGERLPATRQLAELVAAAKTVGEVAAWENECVRVYYEVLEYPAAERRVHESRPVVPYVRVVPEPGVVDTRLLDAPQGTRPAWRPGVVPRGVRVELLKPPPASSRLGEPGTDPPREAVTENHERYRLVLAALRPLEYGVGTGRSPSVTIFLSEGVVEVWNQGARRRMGVQPGDAFWFEAFTRLTVVDDYPVGAVIVQLLAR